MTKKFEGLETKKNEYNRLKGSYIKLKRKHFELLEADPLEKPDHSKKNTSHKNIKNFLILFF